MTRLSFTTTAEVRGAWDSARGSDGLADVVDAGADPAAEGDGVQCEWAAQGRQQQDGQLPHSVTSATATAVSSSSPPATSSIAATADAPQMENPVAMSKAPGQAGPAEVDRAAGFRRRCGDRHRDDRGAADAEVQQLLHPQLQTEQDDGDAQQAVRREVRADVQRGSVQANVDHESAEHDRDRGGLTAGSTCETPKDTVVAAVTATRPGSGDASPAGGLGGQVGLQRLRGVICARERACTRARSGAGAMGAS